MEDKKLNQLEEKREHLGKEGDKKEGITFIKNYVDTKTLVTFFILYLIFIGIPWLYNNKDQLLGKDSDFIIKVPIENFGVEPNKILVPYGFDLIPTDKNKVVSIKNAACLYGWSDFKIKEELTNKDIDSKELKNGTTKKDEEVASDREFRPLFPLPLDSPRRLNCPAVKLPDKPGQYSFTIVIESDKGKQQKEVKFYVTKSLGELTS